MDGDLLIEICKLFKPVYEGITLTTLWPTAELLCTYEHNHAVTPSWIEISQWSKQASYEIKSEQRNIIIFIQSKGLSGRHAVNIAIAIAI